VHHADLAAPEQHPGQGRAHALHRRVLLDRVPDLLVGVVDGGAERVQRRVARHVLVEVGHRGDDDVARDVTGGHAAHPVGDGEQPRPRVHGILVPVPDQAAVTAGRVTHG
jgi:hypothetical protein